MVSTKILILAALCVALPLVQCRSADHSAEAAEDHEHEHDHEHSAELPPMPKPQKRNLPGIAEHEGDILRVRAVMNLDCHQKATQTEIVNLHNKLRAGTQATDMQELTWDDDIAKLAQQHADKCVFDHPQGQDKIMLQSPRFSCGQNLATHSPTAMSWTQAIQMWYDEIKDYSFNGNNAGKMVGHYTQLVWAKTHRIGCGYNACNGKHLYTCNYGPGGNVGTDKPYTPGKPMTKCGNGSSNGLCKGPAKLPPRTTPDCKFFDEFSNCDTLKPYCDQPNIKNGCKRICSCKFVD